MEEKKLPQMLVHSYGFANMTFTMMMTLALYYYPIFLSDVALISMAIIAPLMVVTHVVDAVSVPVSGIIIQKTQLRWGQFRSWLLFIPLLTCVFFTLTFTNLPLSSGLKIVCLGGVYMIAHISLNFAFNGHIGLISVLSRDAKTRARLAARNVQYTTFGMVLYSIVAIPLLLYFIKISGDTRGYIYTVAVLGVLQVIGYWNLFWRTRDYDRYDPDKKLNPLFQISAGELLSQIKGNRQLKILMGAECLRYSGMFALIALAAYYFKYVTGDENWMLQYALYTAIGTFLGGMAGPWFIRRFGRKPMYICACICGAIGYLVLYKFGLDGPLTYTLIISCASFGINLISPAIQAMYMDTAEYGFNRTGKNANAFILSMNTLPIKIGILVALAIIPLAMHFMDYVADMTPTPEFIASLMKLIAFLPLTCVLLAMIIISFYTLTDAEVAEYMKANAKVREEEKTAEAAPENA